MTNGIVSSMSPGYLLINPHFNESASKLSRQHGNSDEKPENYPKRNSENSAAKDVVSSHKSATTDDLNQKEKAIISELEKNERRVLAHEAAHVAVGGRFTGSPKYTRVLGPDGKNYITGGEVSITVPSSSNPKETIRNMEQVRAAALAPMDPSSQDVNVAAAAANAQAQAAAELAAHHAEWGTSPQPSHDNFDITDRIPAELPMVKKYRSSVNNEEPDGALLSINRIREEALSEVKTPTASINLSEYESLNYNSRLAPEDNLYNMRQARRVYYLTSSPKGLWTIDNGFEKTPSSPALIYAQTLNLAA